MLAILSVISLIALSLHFVIEKLLGTHVNHWANFYELLNFKAKEKVKEWKEV